MRFLAWIGEANGTEGKRIAAVLFDEVMMHKSGIFLVEKTANLKHELDGYGSPFIGTVEGVLLLFAGCRPGKVECNPCGNCGAF